MLFFFEENQKNIKKHQKNAEIHTKTWLHILFQPISMSAFCCPIWDALSLSIEPVYLWRCQRIMMVVGCGLLVVGQISIIIQTNNLQTYAFVYTEWSDSIGKGILCFFAFLWLTHRNPAIKLFDFSVMIKLWRCSFVMCWLTMCCKSIVFRG